MRRVIWAAVLGALACACGSDGGRNTLAGVAGSAAGESGRGGASGDAGKPDIGGSAGESSGTEGRAGSGGTEEPAGSGGTEEPAGTSGSGEQAGADATGGRASSGTGGQSGPRSTGGRASSGTGGQTGSGGTGGRAGSGGTRPADVGGEAGEENVGGQSGSAGDGGMAGGFEAGAAGTGGQSPRPECVVDDDCGAPETTPVGCAEASCADGACLYGTRDDDHDGFTAKRCVPVDTGIVITTGDDCDDADPTVNPDGWDGPAGEGHANGCNDGIDQDCSGTLDDGVLSNSATCTCAPADIEPCGTTSNGVPIDYPVLDIDGKPVGECHYGSRECDTDGTWGPCVGAQGPVPETCDGLNNDCDAQVDEEAVDRSRFYCDADGDNHLKSTTYQLTCAPTGSCSGVWREFPDDDPPSSFDDCDDNDPNNFPGKKEICDGGDNNCDGIVDGISVKDDLKTIYYRDLDGDGFGTNSSATLACSSPGSSWVLSGGDCSDNTGSDPDAAQIHPGANEICNGKNDNCNATTDELPLADTPNITNTTFECQTGAWVITSCPPNTLYCGTGVLGGCTTDATTLANCGACNNTCALACTSQSCEEMSEIAGGFYHTCGITTKGRAVCWGNNPDGRLGDGTSGTDRHEPRRVSTITNVTIISAGATHTCAIASPSSTAYCWGSDASGQLGNGSGSSANVLSPGSVNGIGSDSLTGVTSIAAGFSHSCAVYGTGTAACWGLGTDGRLGNQSTAGSTVPSRVIRDSPRGFVTDGLQVVAGKQHSCLLRQNNTVECWGDNSVGQLGNGSSDPNSDMTVSVSSLTNVTTIAAGDYHTCALTSGAQVYCWGYNGEKQLGQASGTSYNTPQLVSGLSGVSQVTAGGNLTCARTGSTAQCWGVNGDGQRGDTSATSSATPTTLSLSGVTRITAGTRHTCAIAGNQTYCWGYNAFGQFGNGTTGTSMTPTPQLVHPLSG
jgi:alpha-tubulin suppressor-like RCC1 family protein